MTNLLEVADVSKKYRLGVLGHGSLRKDLQTFTARLRGTQDPNGNLYSARLAGGELWALRKVSFEVKRGERVAIIGKNGAGKSTLLKLISRVTAPTAGTIRIKGRLATLLEVGTGFHPELTGRENVFLNGAILGMKKSEIKRKFDEIVDFADVGEFIDTPVKRYSSGMYVRLAFSVAAHLEPDILIVDEVLAVGDLAFQKKCIGRMQAASMNEGRTILFVSHNVDLVRSLCDRALYLDDGELRMSGGVHDVVSTYLQGMRRAVRIGDRASPDRMNRTNGKVRFEVFSMTGVDGQNKTEFFTGDEVRLRFKIAVRDDVPNAWLYFDWRLSGGGQVVTNFETPISDNPLRAGTAIEKTLIIRDLRLRPGAYSPYALIKDREKPIYYDVIDQNVSLPDLIVPASSKEPYRLTGITDLEHRWT